MTKSLSNELINLISSSYIANRDERENWVIKKVSIGNDLLNASVCLSALSKEKIENFHLSFFTAMEFASQLQIIFMHDYLNLKKKTEEAWMIESSFSSKSKICTYDEIFVEMKASKMRIIKNYLYCRAEHRIFDLFDGLFIIKINSVMKVDSDNI